MQTCNITAFRDRNMEKRKRRFVSVESASVGASEQPVEISSTWHLWAIKKRLQVAHVVHISLEWYLHFHISTKHNKQSKGGVCRQDDHRTLHVALRAESHCVLAEETGQRVHVCAFGEVFIKTERTNDAQWQHIYLSHVLGRILKCLHLIF